MGIESLLTENAPNAVMLGAAVWVLWSKVADIDKHTSERLEAIRQMVESLRGDVQDQNGRIGRMERWRERREGYLQGWEDREADEIDG